MALHNPTTSHKGAGIQGFRQRDSIQGSLIQVKHTWGGKRDLVDGVGIFGWLEVEERSQMCESPKIVSEAYFSAHSIYTMDMYIYRALLKSTCLLTTE